jgi:uncharacterized protein (TIGR03089 family)
MTTPADLLADALARDGSRPFVTGYDDATGERAELSVATTANWVAKTAGFLADEFDTGPGDLVSVELPLHWQTVVVLLACWAVGAQVSFEPGGAVTFTTTGASATGDVIELSLAPMGADFSRLVAAQPDTFRPVEPSGADLVEAAAVDLPYAARVLTVLPYAVPAGVSYGLIAPMAVSGSVVLVTGAGADRIAELAAAEQVTHTLGTAVAGLPRLDG